jgi:surface protein
MKKYFTFFPFLLTFAFANGQDFITKWYFPTATTQIRFNAQTNGGAVSYTWTASPSGNNGSGSFTQSITGPVILSGLSISSGDTVTLRIALSSLPFPGSLNYFGIDGGVDRFRLLDISQWGGAKWTSMYHAYYGCGNLDISATDLPNLDSVKNMNSMFYLCTRLNGPTNINDWNTSGVTDMTEMFRSASSFSQPIGGWSTSKVTSMRAMFLGANNFNQSLNSWNTSSVSNMLFMFSGALSFNQNLGDWILNPNVSLSNMLDGSAIDCPNYSATLKGWHDNNPTVINRNLGALGRQYGDNASPHRTILTNNRGWTISGDSPSGGICADSSFVTKWSFTAPATQIRFNSLTVGGAVEYDWVASPSGNFGSGSFTQAVAGATTLSGLAILAGDTVTLLMRPTNLRRFYINVGVDRLKLSDVVQWGSVRWTSMVTAFSGCANLNISASDVPILGNVSDISSMFLNCTSLNSPNNINSWNTASVTNMSSLFSGASVFNQPIDSWNMASVTNVSSLFYSATSFNQSINVWNMSKVTNMSFMFYNASDFNQPIGSWITDSVTNMGGIFAFATSFNQNIATWNTARVTNMNSMFYGASQFNQKISSWNTASVTNMNSMLYFATAFNQTLGDWILNPTVSMSSMLQNTAIDCSNYSATLEGWHDNNPTVVNRSLGAGGRQYGTAAIPDRTILTTTQGWTITGDSPSGGICNDSLFVTKWTFTVPTTQIQFNSLTVGGAVEYDWVASPSGNNGSGSFIQAVAGATTLSGLSILAGDTVTLLITPTNLRRFYINNGAYRLRLTDVTQWGQVPWSSMQAFFYGCANLVNITATDIPNLTSVTDMALMFADCSSLASISSINGWNTAKVKYMGHMFYRAYTFNENIGAWNTAEVTSMKGMFQQAYVFNKDIGTWNTSAVIDMSSMFTGDTTFNQNISAWNTSAVIDMSFMFLGSKTFNQDIGGWNTSNVVNMESMFASAVDFNQNIGSWNTTKVTKMSSMFSGAKSFNQNIGAWNTGLVSNMNAMFNNASNFNQNIGGWNTTAVTNMSLMFLSSTAFNQNIGGWNTAVVTDMRSMFGSAKAFNQNLSSWNTAAVTNMGGMFALAIAFNQSLGNWTLNSTVNMGNMLSASGIDCANYSATLNGWDTNNPSLTNRSLGALGLQYELALTPGRAALVSRGWTIAGDIAIPNCGALLPVVLTAFTANCDGDEIQLKWTTALEIDNDYFTLEQSKDAQNWQKIAEVDGMGSTNETTNYEFNLPSFSFDSDVNYFRLSQTDVDGRSETFQIISLVCKNENAEINVFPNPNNGKFVISSNYHFESIALFLMNGRLVETLNDVAETIEINHLQQGAYILKAMDTYGNTHFEKIIVR